MISKSRKLYEAISTVSKTEEYWDAKELDREGFVAVLKFNFGTDSKGNNYIITNDNYEVKRFRADNDKDAENFFKDFLNIKKDSFGSYDTDSLKEIEQKNNIRENPYKEEK